MSTRRSLRLPLMGAGMLALLTGLLAGLLRIGWALPLARPTLAADHGPLMISGFLGTLIGLERAVALGRPWAYAVPLLTAAGGLALIAGVPAPLSPLLMAAGSLGLVGVFVVIVRQQPALFTATMGLGALAWLAGNVLWLAGREIPEVVSWWVGFPVLTIAGERLELSRLLPVTRGSQVAFVGVVGVLVAAFAIGGVGSNIGARLVGLGLISLTVWLLRHDVARRTVRQTGLTRYTALCLLSGYVWLGVGGLLTLRFGSVVAGPEYDAVLHTVLLGFVFAMIFGHAPIIFPAVLGLAVPFRPVFYAHLALLHLSLALRVAGDLALLWPARQWGGLLNAAAVLFFLLNTVRSVWQGLRLSHAD
jgi:hypothetical protein